MTGLVESAPPPSDMKQEDRFWNNWFFIEMQMRLMFSQVDQNPRDNEITMDEVTVSIVGNQRHPLPEIAFSEIIKPFQILLLTLLFTKQNII